MNEPLFIDCIRVKIRDGINVTDVYISETSMKNFDPDFSLEHDEVFELNQVPKYFEVFSLIKTGKWHVDDNNVGGLCITAAKFQLHHLVKYVKKTYLESSSDGKVEITTANYRIFRETALQLDTPRSEHHSPTVFEDLESIATQSNDSLDQTYGPTSSQELHTSDLPTAELNVTAAEYDLDSFITLSNASLDQDYQPTSQPAPQQASSPGFKNPVSLLQEYCVSNRLPTPQYNDQLWDSGEYEVECHVNDLMTSAHDRSQVKAKRDAATHMLKNVTDQEFIEPEVDAIQTLETEIEYFYSKLLDKNNKKIEAFKKLHLDDGRSGTGCSN